jgi:hypothetical protein
MGTAPKVVSDTLKALRRDGIVERRARVCLRALSTAVRRSGSLSASRLQGSGNGVAHVYDIIGARKRHDEQA